MNESVISQSGNINPLTEFKRGLSRIRSEEDLVSSPLLSGNRMSIKGLKAYQIDQEALNRYKRILQKRVAWAFILLFVVIVERIFSGYTRAAEDSLIVSLQESLGIGYDKPSWYLQPIVFLEEYLFFILLMTHYFVILYYYYSAILCLKVMIVHFNAIALISIIEMVFSDPRPYWNDDQISGAGCENSYGFPSFTVFCFLFLFMYTWHCVQEDEHDERTWERRDILKCGVFTVIFGTFCFLKVLGGFEYISQILLTILYSVLFYYLAIFFDKTITNLVEKSSIDVQVAKRYIIYWLIYLLMFAGLSAIIFGSSETLLNIDWFGNYFNCLERYQQTDVLKETPYYHLLGSWGSYLKTVVLFILLGTIFGSSKAFRDFKGVLWYASSKKNKARMTAVANFLLLPSWLIIYFQPKFIEVLQEGGVDTYMFNAFHFTLLYFMLFGVLPKYVFDRWGLLNKEAYYNFGADDFGSVRLDSSKFEGSGLRLGGSVRLEGSVIQ